MGAQRTAFLGFVIATALIVNACVAREPTTVTQGASSSDPGRSNVAVETAAQQNVPSGDAAAADARATFPPGREGALIWNRFFAPPVFRQLKRSRIRLPRNHSVSPPPRR